MKIDPKVAIWINVIVALLTLISSGGLSLAGLVSPTVAGEIVTISGTALAVINAVMHAFSSSTPGPLAPADPPVVTAAKNLAELPPTASPNQVATAKKIATVEVEEHQP